MSAGYDEPVARVGISQILEKVSRMEQTLAVMACDLGALRKTTTEDIGDLEARTRMIEAERWPWLKVGGIVAVGMLIMGMVTTLTQDSTPSPPPPPRPTAGP